MNINMVRGDTHIVALDTTDALGAVYTPAAGDTLTMTVRENDEEGDVVFQKVTGDGDVTIVTGGWQITIQPADTAELLYTVPLVYGIKATLTDGYEQTIVAKSQLILEKAVDYEP